MRMTTLIGAILVSVLLGLDAGHARDDAPLSIVEQQALLKEDMPSEPGKEAVSHVYSFPAGAVLAWHIHPDAHEVVYVIEGDFTMETAGEGKKTFKAGESFYLAPNVVHRGMNQGNGPARIFVVRIKPKDKPLAEDVPPPQ